MNTQSNLPLWNMSPAKSVMALNLLSAVAALTWFPSPVFAAPGDVYTGRDGIRSVDKGPRGGNSGGSSGGSSLAPGTTSIWDKMRKAMEARQEAKQKEAHDANELGCQYYKNGDWAKAIAAFEKALKKEPDNTTFKQNLANARQCLADGGAGLRSQQQEQQELGQRNIAAEQLNKSGVWYLKQKNYAGAIIEFQKALDKTPNDQTIINNLASAKQLEQARAEQARIEQARINTAAAKETSGSLGQVLGNTPASTGFLDFGGLTHATVPSPNASALILVNLDANPNAVDLRGTQKTYVDPALLKTAAVNPSPRSADVPKELQELDSLLATGLDQDFKTQSDDFTKNDLAQRPDLGGAPPVSAAKTGTQSQKADLEQTTRELNQVLNQKPDGIKQANPTQIANPAQRAIVIPGENLKDAPADNQSGQKVVNLGVPSAKANLTPRDEPVVARSNQRALDDLQALFENSPNLQSGPLESNSARSQSGNDTAGKNAVKRIEYPKPGTTIPSPSYLKAIQSAEYKKLEKQKTGYLDQKKETDAKLAEVQKKYDAGDKSVQIQIVELKTSQDKLSQKLATIDVKEEDLIRLNADPDLAPAPAPAPAPAAK